MGSTLPWGRKPTRIELFRHVVEHQQCLELEGYWIDVQTATRICHIHDNLKPNNAIDFMARPMDEIVELMHKLTPEPIHANRI